MIRFFLIFILFLIALTTVWCLVLATVIIIDDSPQFIPLVLGLFASGGVEVIVAGILKVIQKRIENKKEVINESSEMAGN